MNVNNSNIIHLAFAFDQNYIVPFYVLLTSIFYNNRKSQLHIHCIATGVSEKDIEEIGLFVVKNRSQIFFYQIDEDYVRRHAVVPKNNYFTIANYYRLFLPSLLPASVDKLLYLDTDLVVINDLTELYSTNIGQLPFAAVSDPFPEIRSDLGMTKEGEYFNSGVLLIDMENWRKQKITERAMQFVIDYPEKIRWVEQDALNAIQKNNWYRLDPKFNMTWLDVSLQVPAKELMKGKVIIHYTTAHKPWIFLGRNKLRSLYHFYFKKSPKAHEKLYCDMKWDFNTLKTFTRIRVKELYFEAKIDKILPIKSWLTAGKEY